MQKDPRDHDGAAGEVRGKESVEGRVPRGSEKATRSNAREMRSEKSPLDLLSRSSGKHGFCAEVGTRVPLSEFKQELG